MHSMTSLGSADLSPSGGEGRYRGPNGDQPRQPSPCYLSHHHERLELRRSSTQAFEGSDQGGTGGKVDHLTRLVIPLTNIARLSCAT